MSVPREFTADKIQATRDFILEHIRKGRMVKGNLKGNPFVSYGDVARNVGYSIETKVDGLNTGYLVGKTNDLEWGKCGLLISAVVVEQENMKPGNGFFELAEEEGILVSADRDSFWNNHVRDLVKHYSK